QVPSEGIDALLRAGLAAADAGVGRKEGDVAAGLAQAAKRVTSDYAVPFLGHATMEPQNCTAHIMPDQTGGDRVEIWAPTQNGEAALAAAARAGRAPPAHGLVPKTMLRGGL